VPITKLNTANSLADYCKSLLHARATAWTKRSQSQRDKCVGASLYLKMVGDSSLIFRVVPRGKFHLYAWDTLRYLTVLCILEHKFRLRYASGYIYKEILGLHMKRASTYLKPMRQNFQPYILKIHI